MRGKLIELIEAGRGCPDDRTPFLYEQCLGCRYLHEKDCDIVRLADYLIAHGVTLAEDNNALGKWVPVSERLPEDVYGKDREQIVVLVSTKSGKVSQCARMADYECIADETLTKVEWIKNGKFYWSENKTVTHWMPLPKAPKEVE